MSKTAFVTGASSGIGRAVAIAMAQEGYDLALSYYQNKEEFEKTINEVNETGRKALCFNGNLADEKLVADIFSKIKSELGRLDVLVNVAGGVIGERSVPDTTYDYWLKNFDANFFSTVLCAQEVVKIMNMQKGIGKIINISSVLGELRGGRPGIIAYSASKAAVISFTQTLAKQVAPKILVNSVSPGRTFTLPYEKMSPAEQDEMKRPNKIGRFIQPDEIAQMVMAIINNEAMTGEVVSVNGGFFLNG
ncbi:MAG TPA: SDR family oxidoreductase [Candidatus Saccharimonadales bacterium]|nr:SDR family oxidoreductase [Candidatus Saccharimonadales bacterium]